MSWNNAPRYMFCCVHMECKFERILSTHAVRKNVQTFYSLLGFIIWCSALRINIFVSSTAICGSFCPFERRGGNSSAIFLPHDSH